VSDSDDGRGRFDEQTRRDIATYWAVHERAADQARASVIEELRSVPHVAEVVQATLEDGSSEDELNELLARAVNEGDWQPYLDRLRGQGVAYAEHGVAFNDWFAITTAYRRHVVPHLMKAYASEPDLLAAAVRGKGALFDLALATIGDTYIEARERTISKQRAAIAELSTPVLRLRPGLLLLPVVGVIDSNRSRHLTEALLAAIRDNRARVVVMDITGVAEVDSEVANRLVQAAEAARLMGATPILTGLSPGVAQTLVALGVDLKGLRTIGDLQGGIEAADELLGIRVVWERTGPGER
jgi:rsbT co-antagonist protein RsbR